MSLPRPSPATRRDLLLVATLAAALFLPALGARDLWNPDEARYAEVAREMKAYGEAFLPQLNHRLYTQKPPLFFWSVIASSWVLPGGVGEAAARLPSALAAIGTTLLVFLLALELLSRRAAWLAAAAFATSYKVLWQGRFGQIDMLLTLLVTLAVYSWVRSYLHGSRSGPVLFFVFTGLATLAKGPAGFLPPLLAIVTFLLVRGERDQLARLHLGRGLVIYAAVVLAWLVPAGLAGGREYLEQIVLRQNLTRYADPWHHFRPFYYYLTVLPGDFFPWSFFLPTALVSAWHRIDRRSPELSSRGLLLALCWMVVTLVFFSLSPAKRTVYVLTMYPAMALLVGAALDRAAAHPERWRRWVAWPFALLATLFLGAGLTLPRLAGERPEVETLGWSFVWVLAGVVAALFVAAALAWWLTLRGRAGRAVAAMAAGMAVFQLTAGLYLLPRFDVFKSTRHLAGIFTERSDPDAPYGIFERLDAGFLFYTRRPATHLDSEEALREFAGRDERVWIFAERDAFAEIESPPPLWEVARDADRIDGYLLLTNRPAMAEEQTPR